MMLRRLAAIATIAVAALAMTTAPADAAKRRVPTDLKIIQSNIGSGTECVAPADCLAVVNNQIDNYGPDAVALQEVCHSDLTTFQDANPGWDVEWRPFMVGHVGCGTGGKGIVIAAPVIERVRTIDLSGDYAGKDFGAVCADIGAVWVCSTHLVAKFTPEDTPLKTQQVKELAVWTDDWAKVAVAGDFNMNPGHSALDIFRNRGWVETDRADNQPTINAHKFDHIWYHRASDVPVSSVSGGVVAQPSSAHDLLRGAMDW